MNKIVAAAAFLPTLYCVLADPCYATDGASFELGRGDGTDMWRIGILWNWKSKWLETGKWHVGGCWEAQYGQWSGSGKRTINDLGLTPVFRLEQTSPSAISPYVEGAIGFHFISHTRLDDSRKFSTAFQFGDHVGAGARFGEHGRYDLSLRLQHLSNASLKKPNDGINFLQLRLLYHLD